MKNKLIQLCENNSIINKCYLILMNKMKLCNNRIVCKSIHFKNNSIFINGKDNEINCKQEAFISQANLWVCGDTNRVSVGENTTLYGNSYQLIHIDGSDNTILVGNGCNLRNSTFFIWGSNNTIILEDNISAYELHIHIEQNDNVIHIGESTTFHGRDGHPIDIALDEATTIEIGRDCMFSNNIHIRSTDSHSIVDMQGKRTNPAQNVYIGSHCWIGMNVLLLKGTSISNNSVIAASSVCIKKYNESNCVIAGNPARIVKNDIDWNRKFV